MRCFKSTVGFAWLLLSGVTLAHLGEIHPDGNHDYFPDFPVSELAGKVHIRDVLNVVGARDLVELPDDSGRFLAIRQSNLVRISKFGWSERHYAKVEPIDAGGTEGAVSVELHPDMMTPGAAGFGKFYTVTIEKEPTTTPDFDSEPEEVHMHSVLTEWTASDLDAIPFKGTSREVLRFDQGTKFHNLNDVAFGPDGMLYLAVGEDTIGNQATDLSSVYGKILRIDPLGNNGVNQSYGVPADNPFVGNEEVAPEVYAYGLRNPWRINFDRETGDLFAADVGWDSIEEMNLIEPAKHYGWPIKEGHLLAAKEGLPDLPDSETGLTKTEEFGLTEPLFELDQSDSNSIIGGVSYRGERFPELVGKQIFGSWNTSDVFVGDPETGEIQLLLDKGAVTEMIGADRYVSVNEDRDGELYLVGGSKIRALFPHPDFDESGVLDGPDGDIICANFGSESARYDLNGDLQVNETDLAEFLVYTHTLPGDLDFNGRVEFADFLQFARGFGEEGTWSQGDLDCDGAVAFGDFLTLSEHFGETVAPTEDVPEPSSLQLALVVFASVSLFRSKRFRKEL